MGRIQRGGLKVPCSDDLTSFVPVVNGNRSQGAQYSGWLRRLAQAEIVLSQEQSQAVLDFVEWQIDRQ
jgi:hypothetical protein